MQKIVIDTNVIVSALISEGIPSSIIYELVFENKVLICISDSVLEEYTEVVNRKKFTKYKNFKIEAEIVISRIEEIALKFSPNIELSVITDEKDNKFLELSVYAKADYLITGNTNDFKLGQYEDVKIVTPREYWDKNNPDSN